ncbi:hypothetical protein Leryth_011226 [Lithospermum erythrorhizon]|nr:hypothetical protein Leryth_011226 [Lithospermum erythrorhizon]
MLFWAVDNPAPANYLLISGDRDFSNALHQLRMRRYNILLAQPLRASAALVAAATIVWHWTSLVVGGPPLTKGDASNGNNTSECDVSHPSVSAKLSTHQPTIISNITPARFTDTKFKMTYVPKNSDQVGITRVSSMPVGTRGTEHVHDSQQPENVSLKQFKIARHEFFSRGVKSSSSSPHLHSNDQDPLKDRSRTDNLQYRTSQSTSLPDREIYSSQNAPKWRQQRAEEYRPKSLDSINMSSSHGAQSSSVMSISQPNYRDNSNDKFSGHSASPHPSSSEVAGGNCGFLPISEQAQALIGTILLALNTLQLEKIIPTEENITSCIRYGDPRFRDTDVKEALDCAIEHKMILKQEFGSVQLYVGRLEKLWQCVNISGGNPNQYPKLMWDAVQTFFMSAAGRSLIMASECRYEAALVLKKACLKDVVLGEVIQMLNMIISNKKWIIPAKSGWKPITITLEEASSHNPTGS